MKDSGQSEEAIGCSSLLAANQSRGRQHHPPGRGVRWSVLTFQPSPPPTQLYGFGLMPVQRQSKPVGETDQISAGRKAPIRTTEGNYEHWGAITGRHETQNGGDTATPLSQLPSPYCPSSEPEVTVGGASSSDWLGLRHLHPLDQKTPSCTLDSANGPPLMGMRIPFKQLEIFFREYVEHTNLSFASTA